LDASETIDEELRVDGAELEWWDMGQDD